MIVAAIGSIAVVGSAAVAGKIYGARVQAKATAEILKVRTDVAPLIADIKASADSAIARIKKFL